MKTLLPILATMLLGISLIPNVALSKETPQSQSIKCQQLKQQVASLKSKIKVDNKTSNAQFENYVLSGLVGSQIKSSQTNSSASIELRRLSNKYAQICRK